jgi:TPR repeat protein
VGDERVSTHETRKIFGRELSILSSAVSQTQEDANQNLMKRIEKNDPVAQREAGTRRCHEGDFESAVECWTKAAGLGDVAAHYQLSVSYHMGQVLRRTRKKNYIIWKWLPSPVIL